MKKTKKVALLSFASLLALSLVACGDLNGTGGTESGSGDSDVVVVLPGTSGGTSNTNDRFAGKTFYNKSSEAESDTKYVFGNDGTFTILEKSSTFNPETGGWSYYGDFEEPTAECKYSFSSDGKIIYLAINKMKITEAFGEDNERLMTYSEFESFLNSDEAKTIFKGQWDELTPEQKKSYLTIFELNENAGFDGYYQAALKLWLEMLEDIKQIFIVRSYDISAETDSANVSYTLLSGTVDSSAKDLSKMNFTGQFEKSTSSSDSRIGSFSIYSSGSSSVSIYSSGSTTYFSITKIDASKITFKFSSSSSSSVSEEKETFDAAYTIEGSGTDTKIKVTFPADKGGETVELSFKPETMSLYEAK